MRFAVGDLIRYGKEFGVVAAYENVNGNGSLAIGIAIGIQWFDYPDIWWYHEKQTTLFRKVS